MHVISVAPSEGGWMVHSDILAAPLAFRSGGKAEDAAKQLGAALAKAGKRAEIRVLMADGRLLGRFICPPPLDEGARSAFVGGIERLPAARLERAEGLSA